MESSDSMIDWEDWKDLLVKQKTQRRTMDEIVMNYFIVNGFKEVAEAFVKDTGMKPGVPLDSIQNRMEIRKAILEGDIPKAIDKINELNPKLLANQEKIYFMLQQQRIIELIRQGPEKIDECLKFARTELAPKAAKNDELLAEMEKVMALLLFSDPVNSSVGDLLSNERKEKVVVALNDAVLTSQCQSKDPELLHLLRKLVRKPSPSENGLMELLKAWH